MFNITTEQIFQYYSEYLVIGWTYRMAEVVEAVKVYCNRIAGYCSGTTSVADDLTNISDQRNFIQYTILALPRQLPLSAVDYVWSEVVYECCRLTLLIYSQGVVFPMTRSARETREKLVARLYELLVTYYQSLCQKQSFLNPTIQNLMRWVITIGGIASHDTAYRNGYLAILKTLFVNNSVPPFRNFKEKLKSVLWMDMACDSGGQALWNEAFVVSPPAGSVQYLHDEAAQLPEVRAHELKGKDRTTSFL
jgi:hypothetical protein